MSVLKTGTWNPHWDWSKKPPLKAELFPEMGLTHKKNHDFLYEVGWRTLNQSCRVGHDIQCCSWDRLEA
jgi:hypothetical protein